MKRGCDRSRRCSIPRRHYRERNKTTLGVLGVRNSAIHLWRLLRGRSQKMGSDDVSAQGAQKYPLMRNTMYMHGIFFF